MMRVAQLRVLGGAMARVPVDATAFAHRASRIMVNVAALFEGPDEQVAHEAWVTEFAAALEQDDDGAYVNFLGDEGPERIRAAYPGQTWDRLAAIKAATTRPTCSTSTGTWLRQRQARTPAEAAAPDRRPPAAVPQASSTPAARASSASDSSASSVVAVASSRPITRLTPASR